MTFLGEVSLIRFKKILRIEIQTIYSFPLQAVKFNTMSKWSSGTSTPLILPSDMMEIQPCEGQDIFQHIRQQNVDNKGVGLNLGESSGVKSRRRRSKVWEDFDHYKDENGKDKARCKVCEKDFDGSSKLGTTHLRNHSKSCQRKRNGGVRGDNLVDNLSDTTAIKEKSVMHQQLNHLDAARMIIKQGDASLIDSTNIGYIFDVYREEKGKLRNYFEKLSCRLCLAFCGMEYSFATYICLMVWFIDDDWKLKNKIIGLKYFYDDETVMKDIKIVLLELGIENNLSSLVIDGDDWLSNQGSLFFNNELLCSKTFFSSCIYRDYYFHRLLISYHLRESLKRLFNDIIASSENENFRNAIDVAIKFLGEEVTAQVIPTQQELSQKFLWGENSNLLGVVENALGLKETFFELEENIHSHFQNLTKEGWDVLRAIYEKFEDLGDGDFLLQYCSNYNTAKTPFPLLCRRYKHFKELRKCHINNFCGDLVERADNAWCKDNLVLAVASVLDPRFKLDIVKNWYEKIFDDEWETEFAKFMVYLTNIYNEYARDIDNFKSCTAGLEVTNSSISYEMLDSWGEPCKSSHEPNHDSELDLYLEQVKFPSFQDFDILEWWQVHSRYFPTLSRMARDFLSIQTSSHPFSVSDDEMDRTEKLGIAEAYICTKSWLAT